MVALLATINPKILVTRSNAMPSILNKAKGLKLPLIALLGFVFAIITVCSRSPEPKKDLPMSPPKSTYSSAISGIGVVEPKSELIQIGTEMTGIVRTVHVKVGHKVKKGDPLFTLDTRDIEAQITALEASLVTAKLQVNDAEAQYKIVESITDKRAISKDELNRKKFAAQIAVARVGEIEAQLKKNRTTRNRMTVIAPIHGQILSVDVRPGEFAGATGSAEPLLRMGDTSTMHVRVEIDEENTKSVFSTAAAYGIKRGDTTQKAPLTFVRIEPYIRPKQNLAVVGQRVDTRVLQVIYAITPNDTPFFVGEQLDVFIENGSPK